MLTGLTEVPGVVVAMVACAGGGASALGAMRRRLAAHRRTGEGVEAWLAAAYAAGAMILLCVSAYNAALWAGLPGRVAAVAPWWVVGAACGVLGVGSILGGLREARALGLRAAGWWLALAAVSAGAAFEAWALWGLTAATLAGR